MYTIGQISQMFNLPISTLRYYDKEGLFPNIQRNSGIRKFSDKEVETLQIIECLKKSGMEIKNIKQFIAWCNEGPSSYPKRKALFEKQKELLQQEINLLEKNMAMIQFKCWYYEQAIQDGNEDQILKLLPNKLPEAIQSLYDKAHNVD